MRDSDPPSKGLPQPKFNLRQPRGLENGLLGVTSHPQDLTRQQAARAKGGRPLTRAKYQLEAENLPTARTDTAAPVVILKPLVGLVALMPRGPMVYGCGTCTPVPVPATVGIVMIAVEPSEIVTAPAAVEAGKTVTLSR